MNLSFLCDDDDRFLADVTLKIIRTDIANWNFPGKLPFGLRERMSRQWVHDNIGVPLMSRPPGNYKKKTLGWSDLFEVKGVSMPTSMQIDYDVTDNVTEVLFMPTSELRWCW